MATEHIIPPEQQEPEALPEIVSATGETRDGQPLTLNRAPADDLAPWVARILASKGEIADGGLITCGMLSDTAVVRVLINGKWHAETRDGPKFYGQDILLFGPHSKTMPASVRGNFATVSLSLVPGACRAMGGPNATDIVDRIVSAKELGVDSTSLWDELRGAQTPDELIGVLEEFMRQIVHATGACAPDPITRKFDQAAFADPNMRVKDFAELHGIDAKQLERVIKKDFGITPKQVLRRARALDMAAHLRGVADAEEAAELALRYFDQSHLIRDFTKLFGITPTQFVRSNLPFMTMTLELRQARRLEALKRAPPGFVKPWRARL